MKRLITVFMLMTGCAFGAINTNERSYRVDSSKVKGRFDSFYMSWAGKNTEKVTFGFRDGTSAVDFAGLTVGFKVAKQLDSGQTAYISYDTSGSHMTASSSNVVVTVPNTNIPPNGDYQVEIWAYEGVSTNASRTYGQGMLNVFDSLYDADDDTFPFPSSDNLADYYKLDGSRTLAGNMNGGAYTISNAFFVGDGNGLTNLNVSVPVETITAGSNIGVTTSSTDRAIALLVSEAIDMNGQNLTDANAISGTNGTFAGDLLVGTTTDAGRAHIYGGTSEIGLTIGGGALSADQLQVVVSNSNAGIVLSVDEDGDMLAADNTLKLWKGFGKGIVQGNSVPLLLVNENSVGLLIDTTQFSFNGGFADMDFSVGWDNGTALSIDGATGQATITNRINFDTTDSYLDDDGTLRLVDLSGAIQIRTDNTLTLRGNGQVDIKHGATDTSATFSSGSITMTNTALSGWLTVAGNQTNSGSLTVGPTNGQTQVLGTGDGFFNDTLEVGTNLYVNGNILVDGTIRGASEFNERIDMSTANNIKFYTANTVGLLLRNDIAVFNDDDQDIDFRIDGDTKQALLNIDGSEQWVAVGASAGTYATGYGDLHVADTLEVGTNAYVQDDLYVLDDVFITDDLAVTGTVTATTYGGTSMALSATVQAEQLTSTDDASVTDLLTAGRINCNGALNVTGDQTNSGDAVVTGQLIVTDDSKAAMHNTNSWQQTISASGTWYALSDTNFVGCAANNNWSIDGTNFTYTGSRTIDIMTSVVVHCGPATGDDVISLTLGKNGSANSALQARHEISAGILGEPTGTIMTMCVSAVSSGDYFNIYINNEDSTANIDFTSVHISFMD